MSDQYDYEAIAAANKGDTIIPENIADAAKRAFSNVEIGLWDNLVQSSLNLVAMGVRAIPAIGRDIVGLATKGRAINPYLVEMGVADDPDTTYAEVQQVANNTGKYLKEQYATIATIDGDINKQRKLIKDQLEMGQIDRPKAVQMLGELEDTRANRLRTESSLVKGGIRAVETFVDIMVYQRLGLIGGTLSYFGKQMGKVWSDESLTKDQKIDKSIQEAATAVGAGVAFDMGTMFAKFPKKSLLKVDEKKFERLSNKINAGEATELERYQMDAFKKYAALEGKKPEDLVGTTIDVHKINSLVPERAVALGEWEAVKKDTTYKVNSLINSAGIKKGDEPKVIFDKLKASKKTADFSEDDLLKLSAGIYNEPKNQIYRGTKAIDTSLDNPSYYSKMISPIEGTAGLNVGTKMKEKSLQAIRFLETSLTDPISFWTRLDGNMSGARMMESGKQVGAWQTVLGGQARESIYREASAKQAAHEWNKKIVSTLKGSNKAIETVSGKLTYDQAVEAYLYYMDPRTKHLGNIPVKANGKLMSLDSADIASIKQQIPEVEQIAYQLSQKNSVLGRMANKAAFERNGSAVTDEDIYLLQRKYYTKGDKKVKQVDDKVDTLLTSMDSELEGVKGGQTYKPGTLKKAQDTIPSGHFLDLDSKSVKQLIESHDNALIRFIKEAPTLNTYRAVVANKDKIVRTLGQPTYNKIIKSMDEAYLLPKGNINPVSSIINKGMSNVISSMMMNNPARITMVQYTAMATTADVIGWFDVGKAMAAIKNDPMLIDWALSKSKVLSSRYANIGMQEIQEGKSLLSQYGKASTIGMTMNDLNMAATSYIGAFNHYLAKNPGKVANAHVFADYAVEHSQPMTQAAYRSLATKDPVARMATLLQTQQMNQQSRIIETYYALRNAKGAAQKIAITNQLAKSYLYNQIIPGLISTATGVGFSPKHKSINNDDEDEAFKQYLNDFAMGQASNVGVIGNVAFALNTGMSVDLLGNPLNESISKTVQALVKSGKTAKDLYEKDPEAVSLVQDLVNSVKLQSDLFTAAKFGSQLVGTNVQPITNLVIGVDAMLNKEDEAYIRLLMSGKSAYRGLPTKREMKSMTDQEIRQRTW